MITVLLQCPLQLGPWADDQLVYLFLKLSVCWLRNENISIFLKHGGLEVGDWHAHCLCIETALDVLGHGEPRE